MSPVEQTSELAHATRDVLRFYSEGSGKAARPHGIHLARQGQSTITSTESRSRVGAKEVAEVIGRNNPN